MKALERRVMEMADTVTNKGANSIRGEDLSTLEQVTKVGAAPRIPSHEIELVKSKAGEMVM